MLQFSFWSCFHCSGFLFSSGLLSLPTSLLSLTLIFVNVGFFSFLLVWSLLFALHLLKNSCLWTKYSQLLRCLFYSLSIYVLSFFFEISYCFFQTFCFPAHSSAVPIFVSNPPPVLYHKILPLVLWGHFIWSALHKYCELTSFWSTIHPRGSPGNLSSPRYFVDILRRKLYRITYQIISLSLFLIHVTSITLSALPVIKIYLALTLSEIWRHQLYTFWRMFDNI